MKDFTKLPEFKALAAVLTAMAPLKPEGRRKVVEALHALLEISPGNNPSHEPERQSRTQRRKR